MSKTILFLVPFLWGISFLCKADEVVVPLPLSGQYDITASSTTYKFIDGTVDQMILVYWDAEDDTLQFTDVSFVSGGEIMTADLDKGTLHFNDTCNSSTYFCFLGGNVFLSGDGQLNFSQKGAGILLGSDMATRDSLN
jgi:hypothetical protein